MRFLLIPFLTLWCAPLPAQDVPDPAAELLRLHAELLEAHRTGEVERWMAIEGRDFVSVNGGRVTFPELADRRAQRAGYLQRATFEVYRDLRDPVVRVSADGSLGWLIAEVEVRGSLPTESGASEPFHEFWAWVELYEKVEGVWTLVGNASNSRPGDGEGMP